MFIFIILFFIIWIISLIALLFLIITNNIITGYFIISMFVSLLTFLLTTTLFYIKTNRYPLNNLSDFHFSKINKFFNNHNNKKYICFRKENGIWICKKDNKVIKLDLTGYLFQKSYIKSYVIRNLRYSIISDKNPFLDLFRNKYFIKNKMNLDLIMIENNRYFVIKLVRNGISKYGPMAKEITKAPFYKFYLSNRSIHSLKNKMYINEEIYIKFDAKSRKRIEQSNHSNT